jgi:hypothetical protein
LLSELLHDRLLKASNMKVGGGPLYYVPGQEPGVENFVQYLAGKEREAFHLLKKEEILEDSKQDPAIRVALRAIKDFAIPLKVYIQNEEKLFWKLHTMKNEEFEKRINILFNPQPKEEPKAENVAKPEEEVPKKEPEEKKDEEFEDRKPRAKSRKKASFESMVDEWIKENNASIITLSKDSKNAQGRISVEGKGEHILIARNKKSMSEIDLVVASQAGLNEKLPVILLTTGKLSKKAEEIMPLFRGMTVQRL